MASPQSAMNRGQMLALMGAKRNDDGSYSLKEPCSECGATSLHVEWAKPAGLDGLVHHDGDDGCEMSTHDAIAGKIAASPEAPVTIEAPPVLEIVTDAPAYEGPIEYVQFVHPVTDGMQFWSRVKHANKYKLIVEHPWLLLEWGNERRRIPMTNVVYIRERIA